MTHRSRLFAAAVLGLSLSQVASAQVPNPIGNAPIQPLPSTNQRTADIIADHLRQSGLLRNFTVDIVYTNGAATLTGLVGDQSQREEVVRIVQGVPGVERVLDRLVLAAPAPLRAIQAEVPPVPAPSPTSAPTLNLGTEPVPADSVPLAPLPPDPNRMAEPLPIFAAPPPAPISAVPPKMPPYAWPTYAPYNNYSRVAYPTEYPYNAFPFIGPVYPFPKVPLGWRSVKLEWEDGHWWFRKTPTAHDWWRLRYW